MQTSRPTALLCGDLFPSATMRQRHVALPCAPTVVITHKRQGYVLMLSLINFGADGLTMTRIAWIRKYILPVFCTYVNAL
jgi:hypothetical protein